jgi:hypothetical protein
MHWATFWVTFFNDSSGNPEHANHQHLLFQIPTGDENSIGKKNAYVAFLCNDIIT